MRKPAYPITALAVGLLIVIAAAFVQWRSGNEPLELPVPVWVASLVLLVAGLVMGGYLRNIKSPLISAEMEHLPEVRQTPEAAPDRPDLAGKPPTKPLASVANRRDLSITHRSSPSLSIEPPEDWTAARANEYARVSGYMLTHVCRRSKDDPRYFDIFIFLVRHQKGASGPPRRNLSEIKSVEFFFGDSWGNEVFSVRNGGEIIGIRTSAWGTFLATCRISFTDGAPPIVLHRYIDFQMAQDGPKDLTGSR
jgi:hypothetical protein